jgi:electron transport complex protein RnfC
MTVLAQLFRFKGGVKPQTNKTISVQEPIAQAPLPVRLFVPLHQSIGGAPNPLVQAGDTVRKGQLIGGADAWVSAAVHAPTSGRVLAIEEHVAAHPSGLPTLSVVIEPDGRDEWIERRPVDHQSLPPERVRELLRDAGVVGLGGAAFPSHAKLTPARSVAMEQLVINGAECEPFMTCDDMLMRERADEIVRGIAIFRELLAAREVLIGIEDNKQEAIAAMQEAVLRLAPDYRVVAVPTRYPAGGAKQLIRVLTGKEVPASRRSTELGVQCFNVATVYTAYRALACGEPVLSRIVTLTGNVERPRNWEVRLGTPLRDLVALGATESRHRSLPDGRADDGLRLAEPGRAGGQGEQLHHRRFADDVRAEPAGDAVHPLWRLCRSLSARAAAIRVVLVLAGAQLRQDAGVPPLRLYRVRLLQLCLPFAYPPGAVFSFCEERDLVARARKERGRRRQGALRAAQRARGARTGGESGASAKGAAARAAEKQAARGSGEKKPAAADSAADSTVSVASPQLKPADAPAPVAAIAPASLAAKLQLLSDADAIKKATIVAAMERARAQRERCSRKHRPTERSNRSARWPRRGAAGRVAGRRAGGGRRSREGVRRRRPKSKRGE